MTSLHSLGQEWYQTHVHEYTNIVVVDVTDQELTMEIRQLFLNVAYDRVHNPQVSKIFILLSQNQSGTITLFAITPPGKLDKQNSIMLLKTITKTCNDRLQTSGSAGGAKDGIKGQGVLKNLDMANIGQVIEIIADQDSKYN